MIKFEEIIKVFTLPEDEQAQYFPQFTKTFFISISGIELETKHSRMIALCILNAFAKEKSSLKGELGVVCLELAALSDLIIEVSGIYDWLIMHPNEVKKLSEIAVVDSSIYAVWRIIRRLCKIIESNFPKNIKLKPFDKLFSEILLEK
ncbi:MAG: hypothetical protein OEM02_02180 [Desulfobulbaceae bacterium]|nr:hypothetical protein [Desulfobulbaceae bacterium]